MMLHLFVLKSSHMKVILKIGIMLRVTLASVIMLKVIMLSVIL